MTVLEVIQRSTEFLAKKGVESPRLQAELLLAHALALPRMQLYLKFERELSPPELEQVRELVKRRGQREPLQRITGSTSFCGLEIALNPHTLIPRPETELLAEQGWLFLNSLSGPESESLAALDFGTGSGCLAIALAVKCAAVRVWAVDISPEALQMAAQNAARHNVSDRIHLCHGDGFAAAPPETRFQLLIANPPYIPTAELDQLQPEVRQHDPRHALDGGPDGLDFYRRLAVEAGAWLKTGGKIMLEFGDGQAEALRELFQSQNWIVERILDDYTQRPRILIARK